MNDREYTFNYGKKSWEASISSPSGVIPRLAEGKGISTPFNEKIVELVKRAEDLQTLPNFETNMKFFEELVQFRLSSFNPLQTRKHRDGSEPSPCPQIKLIVGLTIMNNHHSESPAWFIGWVALIPIVILGVIFLYFGILYKKEHHEKTVKDEMQPKIFRIMPWWFLKLFLIILGIFILSIGIGYIINVPEHFFWW